MNMLLLVLTLPTESAATRMRAWRALKASGAAVLRDGVYLMPELDSSRCLGRRCGGRTGVMAPDEPHAVEQPVGRLWSRITRAAFGRPAGGHGSRSAIHDDDQLLQAANAVFDGLLLNFQSGAQ